MELITFNKDNTKKEFRIDKMPTVLLDAIHLNTDDKNWGLRLSNSCINITIFCYDEEDNIIGKLYAPISPNVSPYTLQPVIYYNHLPIWFDMNWLFIDITQCKYFKLEIELTKIIFNENETYNILIHLTKQTEYNILCGGELKAIIYITDDHPDYLNKRIVTLIPVTITTHGYNSDLSLGKSISLLYDSTQDDTYIINEAKKKFDIKCEKIRENIVRKK